MLVFFSSHDTSKKIGRKQMHQRILAFSEVPLTIVLHIDSGDRNRHHSLVTLDRDLYIPQLHVATA